MNSLSERDVRGMLSFVVHTQALPTGREEVCMQRTWMIRAQRSSATAMLPVNIKAASQETPLSASRPFDES